MNKKKNLLFIFADQWRADAIGYAQADPVHTPNMDAFCTDATYCDHAFSTFPVCTPCQPDNWPVPTLYGDFYQLQKRSVHAVERRGDRSGPDAEGCRLSDRLHR